MSALDTAAPSAVVDRLAPWLGPAPLAERALFWTSFHGLSTLAHVVVLALLALPVLSPWCSRIDVVEKPPVTVEMAIVEVKPPAPEPPRHETPALADATSSKPAKGRRTADAKRLEQLDLQMLAVLGGNASGRELSNVLSAGAEIDDAIGMIGGLQGVHSAQAGGGGLVSAGGRGEGLGLGSIGTAGSARRTVSVSLDGAPPTVVQGLERMLSSCRPSEPVRGTVMVKGDRVVDVTLGPPSAAQSCMTSRLRRTLGLTDGEYPITVTPR